MKTRMAVLVLGSLVGGWAALSSPAQADGAAAEMQTITQAKPSANDVRMTETVKRHLQSDAALLPSMNGIQLKTVNDVVYVRGTVATRAQKSAIEEKIRSCPGVSKVQNYIKVAKRSGLNS